MASAEERMQILRMIEEGKISAAEGTDLLRAIESADRGVSGEPLKGSSKPRWFRVRVTDTRTGRKKVDVNIPMGLVSVGIKMGAKFAPEIDGAEYGAIMDAVRSGQQGKIMDVFDEEDGEHVEIFVE